MENQNPTQSNPTPNSTAQTGLSSQGQPLQDISNSKLKWVLIILGILEIPLPAFFLFFILPNLISINRNIGANSLNSYFGIGFFAVLLLIALAQFLVGLLSLGPRFGEIKTKVLIAFGIILSILAIPVIFLSVIYPTYNSVSKTIETSSLSPTSTPASNAANADPTANWKTYTNDLMGYRIMYPPESKIDYKDYSNNYGQYDDLRLKDKDGKSIIGFIGNYQGSGLAFCKANDGAEVPCQIIQAAFTTRSGIKGNKVTWSPNGVEYYEFELTPKKQYKNFPVNIVRVGFGDINNELASEILNTFTPY